MASNAANSPWSRLPSLLVSRVSHFEVRSLFFDASFLLTMPFLSESSLVNAEGEVAGAVHPQKRTARKRSPRSRPDVIELNNMTPDMIASEVGIGPELN